MNIYDDSDNQDKPPSIDPYPRANKIILLYSDAKREFFPTEQQYISEAEVKQRAEVIAGYFRKMQYEVLVLPGNESVIEKMQKKDGDIIVNLVDSIRGREDLSPVIPATLELLDVPYTGSGMMGLAINANKFFTKTILFENGIPVPHFQLFNSPNEPIDYQLRFPLIVKLNEIHGSVAIDENSVVESEKDLRKKIDELMKVYKQPILVEEFIVGRELTVLIVDGLNKKVYPGERVFLKEGKYKIVSFNDAWGAEDTYLYEKFPLDENLKTYIKRAFEVLKMDDYARFDIRVDESGRYYFIDANANPAMGPKEAKCAFGTLLDLYNVPFEDVLKRIIANTIHATLVE